MERNFSIPLYRLLLIGLFWSVYTMAFSQVERQIANHWYFGNQYGINFSEGVPQIDDNSAMFTYESSTTVSDKGGNLLFYTNGGGRIDSSVLGYIWNRNHEVMEGGELGAYLGGGYSAAQGAISILRPGTSDQYYLFTIDEIETINTEGNPFSEGKGLSYFEIDMSANGGLGKVTISNEKLITPAFEHLSITKHGNCEDYWLLSRTGHSFIADDPSAPDSFYLFKISDLGIEDALISPIPFGVSTDMWTDGIIKFSPDGRHFINGRFLYEFDKNTGTISNGVDLQSSLGVEAPFPIAFSPDGQILYYFSLFTQGGPDFPVKKFQSVQYDLETEEIFFSSAITFDQDENPLSNLIGTPQLAPDGKMYVPLHHGIPEDPTQIYVVNFPNEKGVESQFTGPVIELSLPLNDPFLRFGNFTDHIFYYDSIETIELDLPDEIILNCEEVEPFTVEGPEGFECILWSTGDTSSAIEINAEGTYWLEVAEGCDIGRDSFDVVFVNDLFDIQLGNDSSICEGEELFLVAEIVPDATYTWQDNSALPFLYAETSGLYWVAVEMGACYDQDSIYLEVMPLPSLDIGLDTLICEESELILDAYHPNNQTYEWQDGSMDTTFLVPGIGIYSVTVTNECGITEDEIFINLMDCEVCEIQFPNLFTPNDDGISDAFSVVTDCEFTDFTLRIFNRWGTLVYQGNEASGKWDGKVNGKPCTSDVFLYLLEYETIDPLGTLKRGIQRGDVTLIR